MRRLFGTPVGFKTKAAETFYNKKSVSNESNDISSQLEARINNNITCMSVYSV